MKMSGKNESNHERETAKRPREQGVGARGLSRGKSKADK